jgi:2-dehydro-3-deoxyphosphooctonate aldolase (KDO 8-P synthase)
MIRLTNAPFFVIAGPCVIESAELCLQIARSLKTTCDRLGIPYVFKASFDKANRSSGSSFRGPGIEDGLVVLDRVKQEVGVPVLTDIHEPLQAHEAASVVDILQIPAFLARQTDLLHACGKTGRAVNVKKGQFMSPQEMTLAIEKIRAARREAVELGSIAFTPDEHGAEPILLTERGTFFGYNRLVNDFTALAVMHETGCPVVFDVTHSTQQPAGLGSSSGGNPHHSPLLARAAVATGVVRGLFLECHPDPRNARSDAATMLPLGEVDALLTQCTRIHQAMT